MTVGHAKAPQTFARSRFVEKLARWWAGAQRRRRIARTARTLQALDDRGLYETRGPRDSVREGAMRIENGEVDR